METDQQAPRCEYPGCHDTASRKFPEMVVRAGRRSCTFRLFCAAHVPADVMHMTATVQSAPPTHSAPTGQIHVPRVWEVTGRKASDQLDADREWRSSQALLSARCSANGRRSRAASIHSGTRSV